MVKGSGVLVSGFSDHLLTYVYRGVQREVFSGSVFKKIRSFKSYTADKLRAELMKIDWSGILSSDNVDFCLDEFNRLFKGVIDTVAPMREIRVKQKPNPWMNSHILAGIRRRDGLLSRFKRNRNDLVLYKEYSMVRNQVQRDIKLAKANFFMGKIRQSGGNSNKLWGLLKSLGYSDGNVSSRIVLEKDGVKIFDPKDVASVFNDFYTTVASKLVQLLPVKAFSDTSGAFRDFYRRKMGLRDPFILTHVSGHFIRKQLLSLNPKKAVGLDDISSLFLRDGAELIMEPVGHIVNLSITTESVPDVFKHARVLPLYKKGSKVDAGNYRPVSVLSVLSKVLERAVHKQLSEYLAKRDLLYENQSGFRGSYSTDTCLAGLTDYIKGEMGKGNLVGLVLLDLQKAFDTVDHRILLDKLDSMGVSSVSWFCSYLEGRSQCVEVDGVRSTLEKVECGVPQGSILGPLLFLVYVNDMHLSVNCRLALYADDSALVFSHSDPVVIGNSLSTELSSCREWLIDNKLSLHMGKTECILFGTGQKLARVRDFQVTCAGTAVNQVSLVKYLGVKLDDRLKFGDHAKEVVKKCAGRIGFLYRHSQSLDFNCRKILCDSLIQPYLDYCNMSWYSSLTKELRNRLDVIQRRMVRFIYSMDRMDHVDSRDLGRLSWLSIPDRVRFFKLTMAFKIRIGTAPGYLSSNFVPLNTSHAHNTRRSSFNYRVSREMANSQKSFAFTTVSHWNELPPSLQSLHSLETFKSRLKQHIFSSY